MTSTSANNKYTFFIKSIEELNLFSKYLSFFLKPNIFLLISGDLGVGKTSLIKLLCLELGIEEKVNSPSFNILNRYWIKKFNCFLNHFDFFRLKKDENISVFDDLKNNNINIIEWPKIASSFWLEEKEKIFIEIFLETDNKRRIILN